MFDLIVRQLKQTNPELVPTEADDVDPIRRANIPAKYKRDILDTVHEEAGPEALLSIGQGIRTIRYDPVWQAIHSMSPAIVFDKWRRFEAFGHSDNRLQIDQTGERQASFQRYTIGGGTPTIPENLLICGLCTAIMEKVGCVDLRCEMQLDGGASHCIRQDERFTLPDNASALITSAWTMAWSSFSPRMEEKVSAGVIPNVPLPASCNPSTKAAIETITCTLSVDVARQWKVGELANEMGLSTRSLQRRLSNAELSFSVLVRQVRIHEACRLLKDSEIPITAIGFCAGFSDSAHFSRDFHASAGMTPSNYRAFWQKP